MRECLAEIEKNTALSGKNFHEKIINAVDLKYLDFIGFSEYETYGNFVVARYPEAYVMRNWRSLRTETNFISNTDSLSEEIADWLAKKYYAVSIEKWQSPAKHNYIESKLFRSLFPPTFLEILEKPYRIITRPIKRIIPAKYYERVYNFVKGKKA